MDEKYLCKKSRGKNKRQGNSNIKYLFKPRWQYKQIDRRQQKNTIAKILNIKKQYPLLTMLFFGGLKIHEKG